MPLDHPRVPPPLECPSKHLEMACARQIRKPPIVILPPAPSKHAPATLVFVHGYNFTAEQFHSQPPDKLAVAYHVHQSPALQHLKIIVPEGLPNTHKSLGKNVWYNLLDTPVPLPGSPDRAWEIVEYGAARSNEDDMEVTLDYFESLVKTEIEGGTPADRIVFLGDSQGATMVALFLLTRRLAANLGAVISYAGFPPCPMQSISRMQQERGLDGPWSKATIFFMLHGSHDVFVPLEIAREWRHRLEGFREGGQGIASLEWKVIEGMRHAASSLLWPHVREILEKVVPEDEGEGKGEVKTQPKL